MIIPQYVDIATVAGIFGGFTWFLFWRYFGSIEKRIDSIGELLKDVVMRPECERRHSDLMMLVGLMKCPLANGEAKPQEKE